MSATQMRAALIAYLEGALKCAEDLEDGPTTYLVERALDEARSRMFSEISLSEPLH
jgi:hypothetical protein